MDSKSVVRLLLLMLVTPALAYAGKPAARLGDMTMHGGSIVLGYPMVLIGGMPAARIGDMQVCPMLTPGVPPIPHVGGPIVLGSPMVLIGGMPAARMGDMAVCVGPPSTIALGCPTVLIGEGGSGSAPGSGGGSGFVATAATRLSITDESGAVMTVEGGVITNQLASSFTLYDECEGEYCPLRGISLGPGAYTVSASQYTGDAARFDYFKDSVHYMFERSGGTSLQTDDLTIGDGLMLTSRDIGEGLVRLSASFVTPTSEKTVEISGLTMPEGDSLFLRAEENNQVRIVNLGEAKEYTLLVSTLQGESFVAETIASVPIAARSQQTFVPPWEAWGLYPVQIGIDQNLDGVQDLTMYVSPLSSAEQIAGILAFFDESVAGGTLTGSGPGKSASGRLNALRNMLRSASNMIAADQTAEASSQLADAYKKIDGMTDPPDFAQGTALPDLTRLIDNLIKTMGGAIPVQVAMGAGLPKPDVLPAQFDLFQNYPNPFNPVTAIRYGLPQRAQVTLEVFNSIGQQVAVLVQQEQAAGYHEVEFDASRLASGVYLYRLHARPLEDMQAGEYVETRKLILLK